MFGDPLPPPLDHRYLRIMVARAMGWSLADVDGLTMRDWLDVLAVLGGLNDLAHWQASS